MTHDGHPCGWSFPVTVGGRLIWVECVGHDEAGYCVGLVANI